MIRKLLKRYNPTWTPRLSELLGMGCIVAGVLILLGIGAALLAAGVTLLVIGYALGE